MTIVDWVLTICTGGAYYFLWVVPRNLYRRDRNKKAAQTWYRSERAHRGGKL